MENNMFTIKNIIIAVLVIILVGAAGTAYYFYNEYQKTQEALDNPEKTAIEETQRLIDQMSDQIALPEADIANGEPTLATVQDKEKLKDQEFFANAENGDKVLIYAKAKKAFLYRPTTDKVINVAPVTIGEDAQATPSATPTDEDE